MAALIILLILVVGWHLLLPMLGITVAAFSATYFNAAMATIIIICIATLLFFVFTGIGIVLLGIAAVIWSLIAIILFPLLFPIVLPALLLMIVVGMILKRSRH